MEFTETADRRRQAVTHVQFCSSSKVRTNREAVWTNGNKTAGFFAGRDGQAALEARKRSMATRLFEVFAAAGSCRREYLSIDRSGCFSRRPCKSVRLP